LNNVGVFRSTDGGNSWSPANNGLADLDVGPIVVDPALSGAVYVGTVTSGVFVSTDGGSSWSTLSNSLSNSIVSTLAIDPSAHAPAGAKLYAGSSVFRAFVAKFSSVGSLVYSTFLG